MAGFSIIPMKSGIPVVTSTIPYMKGLSNASRGSSMGVNYQIKIVEKHIKFSNKIM